jgi:hypothetical protein
MIDAIFFFQPKSRTSQMVICHSTWSDGDVLFSSLGDYSKHLVISESYECREILPFELNLHSDLFYF